MSGTQLEETYRYSIDSRIRFSEAGEDLRLSLGALINYFQDCSTQHAQDRGVGIPYLKKLHQAWIMVSWQIVIGELPLLGDPVRTSTWAYAFQDFFGKRNYILTDPDGREYVRANGIWVLMDMDTGRPVRIDDATVNAYGVGPKLDMEYSSRKIRVASKGEPQEAFCIGRHHLDTNHHVNNGQYVTIAAEYLPEGFRIHKLRVEYRMQGKLGDEVVPYVSSGEGQIVVSLCNPGGNPYAVIEFLEGGNHL